MTKTKALVALPADFAPLLSGDLEELHSQMLATASDTGYEVPAKFACELLVEDESNPGNRQANIDMLVGLHVDLMQHIAAMPKAAAKKPVAEDEGSGDTDGAGKSERKTARKPKRAVEAAKTKEKTVAKKATPKKAVAKKAAAKTTAKKASTGNGKFAEDKKITWALAADKGLGVREGTGREERRKLLKRHDGKTVGAYIKAGGLHATLNRAVEEKVVKVA